MKLSTITIVVIVIIVIIVITVIIVIIIVVIIAVTILIIVLGRQLDRGPTAPLPRGAVPGGHAGPGGQLYSV